jgi:hypothetical protein
MRLLSALGLFAIVISPGLAGRSSATQDAAPAGSYQQTCTDISVQKENLYAKCPDDRGQVHAAKLPRYEKCSADIVNKNSKLECAHGEKAAPVQPSGPYTETCKDIRMKGTTLYAVCKSLDGREAPTSLHNANRCAQGVVNVNGILNCEVGEILPPGTYISTCKDVRLKGTTLVASCNNGRDVWLTTELRDAHKCGGDIANQKGTLRCVPIRMEKR